GGAPGAPEAGCGEHAFTHVLAVVRVPLALRPRDVCAGHRGPVVGGPHARHALDVRELDGQHNGCGGRASPVQCRAARGGTVDHDAVLALGRGPRDTRVGGLSPRIDEAMDTRDGAGRMAPEITFDAEGLPWLNLPGVYPTEDLPHTTEVARRALWYFKERDGEDSLAKSWGMKLASRLDKES